MKKRFSFGLISLAIMICMLLQAFVPVALADEGDPCADGHKWSDWEETQEATCTEGGVETRRCKNCGTEETRDTEAKGHKYESDTTPATCTEAGYTTYTCKRCGDSYTEAGEGALGHDYKAEETPATCTEAGYTTYTCSRCGDSYTEAGEGALGHDYKAEETPATCTEAGYTTYTCSRCGDSYTEAGAAALGHDWGDWTEQQGKRTRVCKRCGAEESEAVEQAAEPEVVEDVPTVEETAEAEATGEDAKEYTIRFLDESGNELQTKTMKEGETPKYEGAAPTKADDEQYTYTWNKDDGWDPKIEAVSKDQDYKAKFTATAKTTTVHITFDCGDGAQNVPAAFDGKPGDPMPTVSTPSRPQHTFVRWYPAIPATIPTEDTSYEAVWSPHIIGVPLEPINCDKYKPTLEDAKRLMPVTAQAQLPGDEGTVEATLTWSENSDPAFSDADGSYVFTATSVAAKDAAGNDLVLESGVTVTCTVVVGPAVSGEYEYRLDDAGKAIISKWNGTEGNPLTVPANLDGHDVIAIGDEAFKDKTGLVAVTLPAGLNSIGASAFEGCSALTTVEVPAGVRSIGNRAFAGCTALTALTLPDTLRTVGTDVVIGDDALTNVTLSTTLASTLTSTTTYTRNLEMGEEGYSETEPTEIAVDLRVAVTDLIVASPKATPFTMNTSLTIESGHGITVNEGAGMTTGKDTVLTNNGTITNNGTLDVYGTLSNLGTVENAGKIHSYGTVVTCGGTWNQNKASKKDGGTFVTKHEYEVVQNKDNTLNNVCKYCGHTEKIAPIELTITYNGPELHKVYDKTNNIQDKNGNWLVLDKSGKARKLKTSDFKVNKDKNHSDVKIKSASVAAKLDSTNAGNAKWKVTFKLEGDDLIYYAVENSTITLNVPVQIQKRPVVVTPKAGLTKTYGTSDPTTLGLNCTVPGLLALTDAEKAAGKSLFTGRMGREKGEKVGKYKYTLGTLDFGNSNYTVSIKDEVFTIVAKNINSTDVGLVTIGNQRYTGKEIKPTITLRYGTLTLKENVDFKVTYTNNKEPGTAKVKLTGIGNYTGERETSFNILKVTSDFDKDTESSGSYTHTGFDDGEFEDPADDDFFEDDEDDDVGRLVLDDVDYGTVLFGAEGEAKPFVLFEDQDELVPGQRTLTIIPDPMTDEETGDEVYLDEEGTRERYPELHLRLGTTLVQTLMQQGVTDIVYELEQAELHIPLASLLAELPVGEAPIDSAEAMVLPEGGTLSDDLAMDDEEFVLDDGSADYEAEGTPEATVGSVGDAELAPEVIQVDSYDFSIEQADATGLTDREAALLGEDELLLPAYRVRTRVIPVDAEQVPTGQTDENGDPITQPLAQELPEGVYLENITLLLDPDQSLVAAPEGLQLVYASIVDQPEDIDESTVNPAEFIDNEGTMAVQILLDSDGMYAVSVPEGVDLSQYLAEEEPESDEAEDEEDFDDEEVPDDEGEADEEFEEIF